MNSVHELMISCPDKPCYTRWTTMLPALAFVSLWFEKGKMVFW